jgi:hypothetical protein
MSFNRVFPWSITSIILGYTDGDNVFNHCTYLVTATQHKYGVKSMPNELQQCFDKIFLTKKTRHTANTYLKGSMRLMYRGENSLHTFDKRLRYMLHQMVEHVSMRIKKVPFNALCEHRTSMKQLNEEPNPKNRSYGYFHINEVVSYVYKFC